MWAGWARRVRDPGDDEARRWSPRDQGGQRGERRSVTGRLPSAAIPTPGGVGGIDAALTAALLSDGVDSAAAASIVLLFRILTFWLPALPGYGFLRYTQAKGIV